MTDKPTTAEQLHEWLAWTGVRFAGVPEASIVERIEAEAVAAYLRSPAADHIAWPKTWTEDDIAWAVRQIKAEGIREYRASPAFREALTAGLDKAHVSDDDVDAVMEAAGGYNNHLYHQLYADAIIAAMTKEQK